MIGLTMYVHLKIWQIGGKKEKSEIYKFKRL